MKTLEMPFLILLGALLQVDRGNSGACRVRPIGALRESSDHELIVDSG